MPSIWSQLGARGAPSMRKRRSAYPGERSPAALEVTTEDPADAPQISVTDPSGRLHSAQPGEWPEVKSELPPTEIDIRRPSDLGRDYRSEGLEVSTEIPPVEIQLDAPKPAPMVAATDIQLRRPRMSPAQVRERSQVLYSLMHKAMRSDTISSLPADKTIDDDEMGAWMAGKKAPSKTVVPFARMSPSYREALGKAAKAEGLKGDFQAWDLSALTPKEQAVLQAAMRDEFKAAQQRKAEAAQQMYAGDPVVR